MRQLALPNCVTYFLVDLSAISLAISSFVFPSVDMPRLLAATINGSVDAVSDVVGVVGAVVSEAVAEASFVALSNSFFARPMERASSGSFCGPQMKITSMTPMTINHS